MSLLWKLLEIYLWIIKEFRLIPTGVAPVIRLFIGTIAKKSSRYRYMHLARNTYLYVKIMHLSCIKMLLLLLKKSISCTIRTLDKLNWSFVKNKSCWTDMLLYRFGYIHILAWRFCPISVIGASARFHIGAKLRSITCQRKKNERFVLLLYDHTSDIYHGQ